MNVESAKIQGALEAVRRFNEQVWDAADIEAVDRLFTDDCILADNNQTLRGHRALKDFLADIRRSFPDLNVTVDDLQATETGAVTRWHAEGTHLSDFRGIPATSVPVSYWGMSVFTVRGGKIAESWVVSTLSEAVDHLRAAAADQKR